MARPEDLHPTPDAAVALPPKPLAERLQLSDQQQQIVSELAVAYLQRNRLEFNKPNLQAALAVLGIDALQRGLLGAGRDEVTGKDNVRVLVRLGLEQRTEIQMQARQVLDETLDLARTSDSDIIGPLALDKGMVLAAARELRVFPLSPIVRSSEEARYLAQSRRAMLPRIAELAISTLPREQHPNASLEQFPNMGDQAAIVRNMLTSLTFRGNPMPIISIDELAQYAGNLELSGRFQPELASEIARLLAGRLQLPEADVTAYISGLYGQVREAFTTYAVTGHPNMKHEDQGATRDQLFRAFRGTLLLLHPALEEQPLITAPTKLQGAEGELSLWSPGLSTTVDGVRVPTIDGLYRAIRLAEGRGYRSERFTNAISAWHAFVRGQEDEASQIDRLRAEIQPLNEELERLQDPKAVLPNIAEWIMKTFHNDDWLSFVDAKGQLRKQERIIDKARESRTRTFGYVEKLKAENKGELPEEAPVPEWLLEERRGFEAGRPRRIVAQAQGRIEHAVENLQQDFLTQYNPDFEAQVNDLERRPTEEVKALSDATQAEIEQIAKDKPQLIEIGGDIGVNQVLQYVGMLIEDYKVVPETPVRSNRSPYWRRQVELARLQKLIKQKQSAGIYWGGTGVPREFYLFCLNGRKKALDTIVYSRRKITTVPGAEEVPFTWSKDNIEQWVKEVEVSTLPDDMSNDLIVQHHREINEWWRKFTSGVAYGTSWPKTVPSRDAFMSWAYEVIDAKARRIDKGPNPDQRKHWMQTRKNLENNIRLVSEFRHVLHNPLYPAEAAEGLDTIAFLYLFGKRIQLANALVDIGSTQVITEGHEKNFEAKKHQFYQEYVGRKKQRLEKKLAELESTQPTLRRFINQMADLNLVIVEPES